MSLRPIKIAVQYLLGAAAIAFFVSLLTFIFSFLGTIFCAALAGMMLGAFKNLRWQSVPVSFLFPAVIVAVLRATRAELAANQIAVLAACAFGAFWLTYVAAAFLLAFEKKPQPTLAATPVQHPAHGAILREPEPEPAARFPSDGRPALCIRPEAELSLGALEGKWLFETRTNHQVCPEKVLEFRDHTMVLSVNERGGRVSLVAQCRVELDGQGEHCTVSSAGRDDEALDEFLVCI